MIILSTNRKRSLINEFNINGPKVDSYGMPLIMPDQKLYSIIKKWEVRPPGTLGPLGPPRPLGPLEAMEALGPQGPQDRQYLRIPWTIRTPRKLGKLPLLFEIHNLNTQEL